MGDPIRPETLVRGRMHCASQPDVAPIHPAAACGVQRPSRIDNGRGVAPATAVAMALAGWSGCSHGPCRGSDGFRLGRVKTKPEFVPSVTLERAHVVAEFEALQDEQIALTRDASSRPLRANPHHLAVRRAREVQRVLVPLAAAATPAPSPRAGRGGLVADPS